MKKCINCNSTFEDNQNFCTTCGQNNFAPVENNNAPAQPQIIIQQPVNAQPQQPVFQNQVPNQQQMPAQNFAPQQYPNQVPVQKKNKGMLWVIIGISAFVVIALVAVCCLFLINTCDSCGDTFFGLGEEVNFFGESYRFCDDCASWFN